MDTRASQPAFYKFARDPVRDDSRNSEHNVYARQRAAALCAQPGRPHRAARAWTRCAPAVLLVWAACAAAGVWAACAPRTVMPGLHNHGASDEALAVLCRPATPVCLCGADDDAAARDPLAGYAAAVQRTGRCGALGAYDSYCSALCSGRGADAVRLHATAHGGRVHCTAARFVPAAPTAECGAALVHTAAHTASAPHTLQISARAAVLHATARTARMATVGTLVLGAVLSTLIAGVLLSDAVLAGAVGVATAGSTGAALAAAAAAAGTAPVDAGVSALAAVAACAAAFRAALRTATEYAAWRAAGRGGEGVVLAMRVGLQGAAAGAADCPRPRILSRSGGTAVRSGDGGLT